METTTEIKRPQISGAFGESLKRNNSKIKQDRADAIIVKAEKAYRRRIEDIGDEIFAMNTERDAMLDLSPDNAQSLILASDFNQDSFVTKEEQVAIKMRERTVVLEMLKERYKHLFGKEIE